MPSRTIRVKDEFFTSSTTYSWSECGTYDDQTGYVTCNACNHVVYDEWDAAEEDEIEWHKRGECKPYYDMLKMAMVVGEILSNVYPKRCEWCGNTPCDCPF